MEWSTGLQVPASMECITVERHVAFMAIKGGAVGAAGLRWLVALVGGAGLGVC